jgi:integrase
VKTASSNRTIAFLGDYLPRKCGIATFTSDLLGAVAARHPQSRCFAMPVNDIEGCYRYLWGPAFYPAGLDGPTSAFAEATADRARRESTDSHLRSSEAVTGYPALANAPMDGVKPEIISGFMAKCRAAEYQVSSINRALQVLRRMLRIAVEWGKTEKAPPRISLSPGERRRERVLSLTEEAAYLTAAQAIGDGILEAYQQALEGIRATQRGEQPIKPRDPFLLRDVATVLLDCALRLEECHRLRWEHVRNAALNIPFGKIANARRSIPLPSRSAALLEMRRSIAPESNWVFSAPTKSGHVGQSSLKKRHAAACTVAGIEPLPVYTFRHTCLTRWRTWTRGPWPTSPGTATSKPRGVTSIPTWTRAGSNGAGTGSPEWAQNWAQ